MEEIKWFTKLTERNFEELEKEHSKKYDNNNNNENSPRF